MRTAEEANVDGSLDFEALRAVLREHPVRVAILFGSHATGTTHSASDVDLAVEFDSRRPSDSDYNSVFLGLSADLSGTLGTDAVDLVDVHALSPALARAVFDHGVLLVGDHERAAELRRQVTATDAEKQSPRERLDAALEKIDAHLDGGERAVPAAGESESDG